MIYSSLPKSCWHFPCDLSFGQRWNSFSPRVHTHTFMVFSHNSNEIQWKYKSLSSSRSCELVIWFFFSFYFHRSIWVMFQRKTASFKFNYIMCININKSIDVIWVALVRCCTFSVCLTHSCHGNIIGQTRTGLIIDKKTHNFVTIYVRYEFFFTFIVVLSFTAWIAHEAIIVFSLLVAHIFFSLCYKHFIENDYNAPPFMY